MNDTTAILFSLQDKKYADFHRKIVPDTSYEIIGVRIPEIRKIVKTFNSRDKIIAFLDYEHRYYEEYLLHGLLISKLHNQNEIYGFLEDFLPYIDNWAICDTVVSSLKPLLKNQTEFLSRIKKWLKSEKTYTVRFGIVCLLSYFINERYIDEVLGLITKIQSEEYYINMSIAWFYSIALVKFYDKILPLIESRELSSFIQNKTIAKARDSFRITQYLKKLKI